MVKKQEQLLENIYNRAYEYEGKYGACPQAVLAALQDFFEGIDDQVIKAVHAFAGGGALYGDGTCGALVGGLAAISSYYGRERSQFGQKTAARKKNFSYSGELHQKFTEKFGGATCRAVQENVLGRSFNLWDPKDYQEFEAAGGHDDKCTNVSGCVARWTAEILLEKGIEPKL